MRTHSVPALSLALPLALAAFASPLVRAQEMAIPTPPVELKRYARLIGNWEGSGTVVPQPGAPAMKWTANSSIKKALSNFFVQEDLVIEFAGGGMGPMVFRSFYGYDAERKRYMSVGVGNASGAGSSEIFWPDDDTMITSETKLEEGKVVSERWVTKLGEKNLSFIGYRSVGAGDFFVHVEGSMKPSTNANAGQAVEAAASMAPPGEEMAKLNRCAGIYRMKGTYQPMPGMEPMEIAGTETLKPRFGGSVLEATVVGDPAGGINYEAWAAWAWNENKNSYTSLYVNNMGEISTSEIRWVGNTLVNTEASLMQGVPIVVRGVITTNENGVITKSEADGFHGATPAYKLFAAVYTKQ